MDNYRKKSLETLVRNIKTARAKLGFTQEKLAETAKLSIGAIKQIESKQRFPRPETLDAIAKALKMTADALTQDSVEVVSTEDIATKVYNRIKDVMALQQQPVIHLQMPNAKPHLQGIIQKLERLDPVKDSLALRQIDQVLEKILSTQRIKRKAR